MAKMNVEKFILLLLCVLHTTNEATSKSLQDTKCQDCIPYYKCPSFHHVLSNNLLPAEELANFICSYTNTDKVNVPYVCCTDFKNMLRLKGYETQREVQRMAKPEPPAPSSLPDSCGHPELMQRTRRVVRGQFANLYELPWMAHIRKVKHSNGGETWQYVCGGSIISHRYILTAAHCVYYHHKYSVGVGYIDYSADKDCQYINDNNVCEENRMDLSVENKIIHPNYNHVSLENDIALLRVNQNIEFGSTIQAICLPVTRKLRAMKLLNEYVTIAGWGATEISSLSKRLKKAKVPVKSCHSPLRNVLCAGDIGKDTCEGDSGSPLLMKTEYYNSQRFVQFGLTSFGSKSCGVTPGIYTDVRQFVDWILENI